MDIIYNNISNILNNDNFSNLCGYLDEVRKDMGKPNFDKSYSSSKLLEFSNIYLNAIRNELENSSLNIKININFNNTQFFGLYTSKDALTYYIFDAICNENVETIENKNQETFIVEIDNLLLISDLSSDIIVKLITIEIMCIYYNFEKDNIVNYILNKVSNENRIIIRNSINENFTEFLCKMYINSKYSTFRALYQNYPDSSYLDLTYTINKLIVNFCPDIMLYINKSNIHYNHIKYDGFNCTNLLDFMLDKICTDGDSFIIKRIKLVKSTTNVNIIKYICDKYLDKIISLITFNEATDSSKSNRFKNTLNKVKDKYKEFRELNKIKGFNKVYDLYYNRYYELKIRSSNLDDEYTALIFIRDINSIISTLNDYIFDISDEISKDKLDKIKELLNDYNSLRNHISKLKIPKYSRLGIWTPREYDKNPYNMY